MSSTTHKPMTAEALLARRSQWGWCELVRGELIQMTPPGYEHGQIAFTCGFLIGSFVREHNLGKVLAAETGFVLQRNPDTVRAPDVAFLRKERVPTGPHPEYYEGAPDLAVEVLSPDDRAGDVAAKVEHWLAHGTGLVWVVDPQSQTVTAHAPDQPARRHALEDEVSGGEVLPGFSLAVRELFTE